VLTVIGQSYRSYFPMPALSEEERKGRRNATVRFAPRAISHERYGPNPDRRHRCHDRDDGHQLSWIRHEQMGDREPFCFLVAACPDNRISRNKVIISRPGDAYSAKTVRRDVQALRDTGFFEDVRLEVEDSPHQLDAKIVVFIVRERPIVRRIEYRGIKTITEPEIRNALNDKGVRLSVGDWFDQTKLARAALVINGLLSARGSPSATVKATFERFASANTVNVVFDIDEGPRSQPWSNPH